MSGDANSTNNGVVNSGAGSMAGGGRDLSISTYCSNRIKTEPTSPLERLFKWKANRMKAVEKERNILSPAQFSVKHEQSLVKYPIKNEQTPTPAGMSMSIEDMKIMPHFVDRTQSQAGILNEIRALQIRKEEAENKSTVLEKYFEAQQREYRSLFRQNSLELEMMHTQQVALIKEIGEHRSIGLDYKRRFATMKQEYLDSKQFYENYIKDLKGTIFEMQDNLIRSKQKEKKLQSEIISLRSNSPCPSSLASPRGRGSPNPREVEEGIRKTLSQIPLDLIPRPIPENRETRINMGRTSPYATLPRTNTATSSPKLPPVVYGPAPPKPPRSNIHVSPKAQISNIKSPDRANIPQQQPPLAPIPEVREPVSVENSTLNNSLANEDEEVKPVIWSDFALNKTESLNNLTEKDFPVLNDKLEDCVNPSSAYRSSDSNSTSWASFDSDDQDQRSDEENPTSNETTVINMQ